MWTRASTMEIIFLYKVLLQWPLVHFVAVSSKKLFWFFHPLNGSSFNSPAIFRNSYCLPFLQNTDALIPIIKISLTCF